MIKKIFIVSLLFSLTLVSLNLHAQVVYEPLSSSVYGFLDRTDLTGIISVHSEVKPFSRIYIAEKLREMGLPKFPYGFAQRFGDVG